MKLTDEERVALVLLMTVIESRGITTFIVRSDKRGPVHVDMKRPLAVVQKLLDRTKGDRDDDA